MIAGAMVFVLILLLARFTSIFSNIANYNAEGEQGGLTYNNEILGNLVSKDTDGDGVLNWEEGLWGTNPYKKDSNDDGTPDNIEIEKLKKQKLQENGGDLDKTDGNLTETDKFSRELFSTVAALNQSGALDEATLDQISTSLAERLDSSTPVKIYTINDIKVIKDDSKTAIKAYDTALNNVQRKYTSKVSVVDVLAKFTNDPENVDPLVLQELNPIIEQMQLILNGMKKASVPQSLAAAHISFLNALQTLVQNLKDIQLYDTDSIVALSAIGQYEGNTEILQTSAERLQNLINLKLNN